MATHKCVFRYMGAAYWDRHMVGSAFPEPGDLVSQRVKSVEHGMEREQRQLFGVRPLFQPISAIIRRCNMDSCECKQWVRLSL